MTSLYHAPSQLFIAAIVIIVFVKTWHSAKANKLGKMFTIVWVCLWLIILLTIFNLPALSSFATALGIGRGVDLVIYLSLIFIFYMLFSITLNYMSLKRDITKLVRKDALREVSKLQ